MPRITIVVTAKVSAICWVEVSTKEEAGIGRDVAIAGILDQDPAIARVRPLQTNSRRDAA